MKRKVLFLVASLALLSVITPFAPIATHPTTDQHVITAAGSSQIVLAESQTPTVYITRTGHKYHVYGCRYLRQSCISISLKEAKSLGYGPCSICGPPL